MSDKFVSVQLVSIDMLTNPKTKTGHRFATADQQRIYLADIDRIWNAFRMSWVFGWSAAQM